MEQLASEILIYGFITNVLLVLMGIILASVTIYLARQVRRHTGCRQDGYFAVAVATGILAISIIGFQGADLLKVIFTPTLYLFEQTKGLMP